MTMHGYKITLKGLPEPFWGCETTVTDYNWENVRPDNILEISVVRAEYLVINNSNAQYVFKNARLLSTTISNENLNIYSYPETQVSITSIAAKFKKLKFVAKELTTDDCTDCSCLLVPAFMDSLSDDEMDEINILLHKFIKHNERDTQYDKIKCYSIFYDILAKIDSYVRKQLTHESKDLYNHYVKKVNWIIQDRYNTKLAESEIAKELGISVGYLCTMYKKYTGRTILEYLLMYRMRKAEALLENSNMPTVKIALAVGFEDENYFRKKFKQYFGMNIREYKSIKRGNTLYHGKPIQKRL